MKWIAIFTIMLSCSLAFSLPVDGQGNDDKMLSIVAHDASSLRMEATNMGYIGPITYPYQSLYMLYKGSTWISAKRYRRDSLNRRLYWLTYPPTAVNDTLIYEGHPLWNPYMVPAVDSLSTCGFDGDMDLYELLPAYNPLLYSNPAIQDYYNLYNSQDKVLSSILGFPSPRPFTIPDPQGTYCFSIPQGGTFPTPGFETLSAYYYDFCPFGTDGERDYGTARSQNNHIPLGLSIHRESYSWPVQGYDRYIILKNTIYNTTELDTLFDLAISELVDCDIYPVSYGSAGASDDVSGYVRGPGYEFAYTRDLDWDGGLSSLCLGHKLMIPGVSLYNAAWYWQVGDGPNDYVPRSLSYTTRRTANEKYWLATGRNPNYNQYSPLRHPSIPQYEQQSPNDTRFLNTMYGAFPTPSNPNPTGRFHLAPGAGISFYTIYFVGNSVEDLKSRSLAIENFINAGMQIGDIAGLSCLPYFYEPTVELPGTFHLAWQSYTDPHHFEVLYKVYDAPASQWVSVSKPGNSRSHDLSNLSPNTWYEMKLASIYNPGPNEVYLESVTRLLNINNILDASDPVQMPGIRLLNYPNPFNPSTTAEFELTQASRVSLAVYNLKGQVVKVLADGSYSAGTYKQLWDGTDNTGTLCSSGIYYLRLLTDVKSQTRKILLMK